MRGIAIQILVFVMTGSGYGMTWNQRTPEVSSSQNGTPDRVARLKADRLFPASNFLVDVTKVPYGAKGDGKTDDTAAIQRAINDVMGLHKVLYFPNGTYLLTKTLQWTNKNSKGNNAYGFNWLQGQSATKTILRQLEARAAARPAGFGGASVADKDQL